MRDWIRRAWIEYVEGRRFGVRAALGSVAHQVHPPTLTIDQARRLCNVVFGWGEWPTVEVIDARGRVRYRLERIGPDPDAHQAAEERAAAEQHDAEGSP